MFPLLRVLLACLAAAAGATLSAAPVPVVIVKEGDQFTLLRGGKPYYVNGAGGLTMLSAAARAGANSTRTWSHHNIKATLDEAGALGMTVAVGFWLSHKAADYESEEYKKVVQWVVEDTVAQIKDHPAVLCYALGNEVDIGANVPAAWRFVDELAVLVKKLDPLHPTMTVIAGPATGVMDNIAVHAPNIDMLGVNAYAGIVVVPQAVAKSRFKGPYLVTEWGPLGHWEVGTTPWGAPWEQTSEEKTASYERAYREFIRGDARRCVGSYVFLWGQKQERTPTWYGVFAERASPAGVNGEAMPAHDVMHKLWRGEYPANRAPAMTGLWLDGDRVAASVPAVKLIRRPGDTFEVEARATDPEGRPLRYLWELLHESTVLGFAGSPEPRPDRVEGAVAPVSAETPHRVRVTVPPTGNYRLFAYALDGEGGVGTANFPFASTTIRVVSPADGARFAAGEPVVLRATAADTAEDGTLRDLTEELTWSHRKGRETITLGKGGEVTVTTLPPGDHTLNARGKNLAGRTMVAPVRITIAAP